MWRQTQWNALSGMFLPACFRRGSSSVNAAKANVCVCVCARQADGPLCTTHASGLLLLLLLLPPPCFVSSTALRPSAVFSPFRSPPPPPPLFLAGPPLLRESSSDISRACPSPHSSAASEECGAGQQAAELRLPFLNFGSVACHSVTTLIVL